MGVATMEERILTKEQLLIKSEGVKDCVKWLKDKLKEEKESLKYNEKMLSQFGMFDDCGPSYRNDVVVRIARMESLVEAKIGLEKYMKKLRHMAEEV